MERVKKEVSKCNTENASEPAKREVIEMRRYGEPITLYKDEVIREMKKPISISPFNN